MKVKRFVAMAIAIAIFLAASVIEIQAAPVVTPQDISSQALLKLEVLHRDSKGSLRLKEKTRRYEFIEFVNAMMCYEPVTGADAANISFKDVTSKHRAYNDIRTAAANHIIEAYGDGTIKPDRNITYSEALRMVLKALGYAGEIKDLDDEGIILKSDELGLSKDVRLTPGKQLTRGEAILIIYNALTVDFADTPGEESEDTPADLPGDVP